MNELLASIKSSIKPSQPDYIPPTRLSLRSDPLQNSVEFYSRRGVSKAIETTHNRDKVVREIVTTERIDSANNKTINIKTYDAATNTINRVIQRFDSANNMSASVVRTYDYDPVNKTVKLTGRVRMTQKFDSKNNVIERIEKTFNAAGKMINVSINTDVLNGSLSNNSQLADAINSFPTKESTAAPVDTIIGSHASLGPRNLVPAMNYASSHSGCPLC